MRNLTGNWELYRKLKGNSKTGKYVNGHLELNK